MTYMYQVQKFHFVSISNKKSQLTSQVQWAKNIIQYNIGRRKSCCKFPSGSKADCVIKYAHDILHILVELYLEILTDTCKKIATFLVSTY